MPELKLLFLQMVVILVTARVVSIAFKWIGQPGVVGEMAAGILLGPSVLGHFSPATMARLFPSSGLGPLYTLSQLGLVLFMFVVGLEVRPETIRSSAKTVVTTSLASIVAPFLCGAILARQLYPQFGSGSPLAFVLFLGAAMSITAFPVLARILADRELTNTRPGTFAISCAAIDDVTAWCLLAIISVIARDSGGGMSLLLQFGLLGLYVFVMVFLIRPLLRRFLPGKAPPTAAGFAVAMILLLASAGTAEALAVHALFGAFMAGLMMPRGGILETELRKRMESVTVALLLPLFFAWNGLRTSIGLLNNAHAWLICGLITLLAIISKLLVSTACVRAGGMPWREALAVGVLVNTKGLVELVILNAGLDLHILSPALFSMMVIMALATTLMTAPLIDRVIPRTSNLCQASRNHVTG